MSIAFFCVGFVAVIAFNVFRHSVSLNAAVALKIVPSLMMCAWIILISLDKSNALIFIGLVFSLIGDVFMELPGETSFIIGIGTNTIGILCYAIHFYLSERSFDGLRLIPVAIVMGVFYLILFDYLDELAIPVLIYCMIHTLFIWRASARLGKGKIPFASQYLCFCGCVSITISDFLLSLTLFGVVRNDVKFQVVDMVLWWSGLFLLALTAEIHRFRGKSASPIAA